MCCQSIAQPNKLSSPIVYLNLFVLILEEVNSHSAVRADFQKLYFCLVSDSDNSEPSCRGGYSSYHC